MAVCARCMAQLPVFWRDDPEGWFVNCESQFFAKGISQNFRKYHYCVVKLDSDTSRRVQDLVRSKVTEELYGKLKARLRKAFQLTSKEKIDKMLGISALGDRKPSKLMADLVELCPFSEDATTFVKRISCVPCLQRSGSGRSSPRRKMPSPYISERQLTVWVSTCCMGAPACHAGSDLMMTL